MARSSVNLVFGRGVDRSSGILATSPEKMRELRNFHTTQGKIEARKGLAAIARIGSDYAEDEDSVVSITALFDERASVQVMYRAMDRTMEFYRAGLSGFSPSYLADWDTLHASAITPPRIISATSYGKAFFAHDEPSPTFRLQTAYYDALSGSGVKLLEADLGDYGSEPVYFRGVVRHLNYLVGWGWGSLEDDRPEFLRISRPGEPTVFPRNWYFIVGQRNDPIVACAPVGKQLAIFKASESYILQGATKENFGVVPLDSRFGIAGSRLAVTVDGWGLFFWSLEGPRITTGGESEDLSLPLDLDGPSPSDLAAAGELEDGIAAYVPRRQEVWFIFGRRVYALSLRIPNRLEWAYHEFPWEIGCAGTLYLGGRSDVAPTGHPEFVSAEPGGTTAEVTVENVDAAGDEITEIWLKESGGTWSMVGAVNTAGAEQVIVIDDLVELTDYEVAFRFRRGALYTDGYESSNPEDWPASARGTFTTTLAAPTNLQAEWERTSATDEQITLTWTNADPDYGIQILRGGSVVDTLAAGETSWVDELDSGELEINYAVRHVNSGNTGSEATVSVWAGPTQLAPTFDSLTNSTVEDHAYVAEWTVAEPTMKTSIWDDYDGAFAERVQVAANDEFEVVQLDAEAVGETVLVFVRHVANTFGVDDFGPPSDQLELLIE